jgi:hypothetical protein
MFRSILKHQKNALAFSAAVLATSLVGGPLMASATPSDMTASTHGMACAKIDGLGTGQLFANGYKNINTTKGKTVTLLCPLANIPALVPGTDTIGLDAYDQSDNPVSTGEPLGGVITAQSCYTNRGVSGGGCGTALSSGTTFTGFVNMNLTVQASGSDPVAPRYVQVVLPSQDVSASHVRDFGVSIN